MGNWIMERLGQEAETDCREGTFCGRSARMDLMYSDIVWKYEGRERPLWDGMLEDLAP